MIKLSHRQARNISIGLMLFLILLYSILPWMTSAKLSSAFDTFFTSFSNVNKALQVMDLINDAREDFDWMVKGQINNFQTIDHKIDKALKTISGIEKENPDVEIKAEILALEIHLKKFRTTVQYYINALRYDRTSDTTDQLERSAIQIKTDTSQALSRFVRKVNHSAGRNVLFITHILSRNGKLAIAGFIGALILGSACAIFMTKALSEPLNDLIRATNKIAEGDLDSRATISHEDEIGTLGHAFNKMAKNLQEKTSQINGIINSMPFMLFCTDSDGKVLLLNQTAKAAAQGSLENHEGRFFWDILPQFEPLKDQVLEKIRKNMPTISKQKNVFWDQGGTHYDITIYPIENSKDLQAVILIQDISDFVKMKEAVFQGEKMRSIGGLAAGMAHEINNPLAGIMQNSRLISNRLSHPLPANEKAAQEAGTTLAAIQDYMDKRNILSLLENIHTAGKAAAGIVKDMLSYANQTPVISRKSLNQLLEKALELAAKDYDMKKIYRFGQIQIIREFGPSDSCEVECDENKLIQVFFNIFQNAAQAMHQGLAIDSTRPELYLRTVRDNAMVQIEIRDNGPGMNKKTVARVFEPFFTTRDTKEGTGLGLSLSYFIITRNHKGEMRVVSSPGKGTAFIIRLPAPAAAKPE